MQRSVTSHAEASYSERERRLAGEVDDFGQLHALSLRLATNQSLPDVLKDALCTAATMVGARLGSVQLVTAKGHLEMIGQVGFGKNIVDEFPIVRLDDCSVCAEALRLRSRVVVRNLRTDPKYTEIAAALLSYGAVAAVSTPVLDSNGKVLAMFSVYWLEDHQPSERELRALDLCGDLAGRHVERSAAAKAAQDRQTLLIREQVHRAKNLISVIQAIASRTLSGDRTVDEAREVLIGRLQALAKAHDAVGGGESESVSLHDIVSGCLMALADRIDVRGPSIAVHPKVAQTLALVFHELTTNAAKYGSLSVPQGRIEIIWELIRRDGERFHLSWIETDGPRVNPPARKGFGSVIVTSVVGKELNCAPTIEYTDDGFQYRLECQLNALTG